MIVSDFANTNQHNNQSPEEGDMAGEGNLEESKSGNSDAGADK